MTDLRIDAVRRPSRDPARLSAFYERALDFTPVGVSDGRHRLRLGAEHLELALSGGTSAGGEPAPSNAVGFQHVAVIVSDMDAAMARLNAAADWTAISIAGAEHLPAASGGVRAFKFRDPEGHPAEILQFPQDGVPPEWQVRGGLFLGVDHTAITVAQTARSIAFYETLGFSVLSRQVNRGIEQARMDAVPGAVVEVTGLRPPGVPTPHLELLCYLEPGSLTAAGAGGSAIVFAGAPAAPLPAFDPDGHRLRMER